MAAGGEEVVQERGEGGETEQDQVWDQVWDQVRDMAHPSLPRPGETRLPSGIFPGVPPSNWFEPSEAKSNCGLWRAKTSRER